MENHKINKLFFVQVLLLSVLRLLLHLSAFFVVCIFTFNFNIAMSPKKCIYTKIFLDMYIYLYVWVFTVFCFFDSHSFDGVPFLFFDSCDERSFQVYVASTCFQKATVDDGKFDKSGMAVERLWRCWPVEYKKKHLRIRFCNSTCFCYMPPCFVGFRPPRRWAINQEDLEGVHRFWTYYSLDFFGAIYFCKEFFYPYDFLC